VHKLLSDLFSETGRSDYKGLSKVRIGKIELYQKDSDSHLMISIDSNVEEENDLAILLGPFHIRRIARLKSNLYALKKRCLHTWIAMLRESRKLW